MQQHGIVFLLLLVLIFSVTVTRATGIGQEREGQSALRLLPPPEIVQELSEARRELQMALNLLVECFGHPVDLNQIKSSPVTITAYSSTPDQCDSTPHHTATGYPVRVGVLAVSRDLIEELGLSFGQRVLLPGYGLFEIRDLMHPRWKRKVDIWESDRESARLFGKQKGTLIWVETKRESA